MRMFARTLRADGRPIIVMASGITIQDIAVSPTDAVATLTLEADGDIMSNLSALGTNTDIGDWCAPKSAAAASGFEVLATVTAGSLTAGTTGSWLAMTSDRSWTKSRVLNVVGSDSVTIQLDFRRAGTTQIIATKTVSIVAEVT